jgi:hypothetical protein
MQMTTRAKIATTVLLLVALTGVGAADYYFEGREYAAELTDAGSPDTGSGGVAKAEGPDVAAVLGALGLQATASEDLTFLAQVSRDAEVHSLVVLQGGDRAGSVSWIDGDAKDAFIALKQALLTAFSDKVEGLSDKTYQDEGSPTRNVLTFRDPALSEETLTFVRVRERLYEFHATGSGTTMQAVIDGLTTK